MSGQECCILLDTRWLGSCSLSLLLWLFVVAVLLLLLLLLLLLRLLLCFCFVLLLFSEIACKQVKFQASECSKVTKGGEKCP